MSWKNVQYENGKYRTSESGGGGTVTDVQVDGVSVVNQGVAEIPAIPEDFSDLSDVQFSNLTDHQPLRYNATSQKWENGADSYPPLIYSDDEREVGVWRDGKPLYQKSIFYDNTTADSNYCITKDVSALSIDRLVNTQFASLNINGDQVAIPYYGGSTNDFLRAWLTNNNATITIQRGRDYAKSSNAHLTILYTKTTDTAGSGTWTTQGGYAHHYSTTEHVIGTWIDGKPLYERTYYITSFSDLISGGYTTNTIVNDSINADIAFFVNGYCKNTSGRAYSLSYDRYYSGSDKIIQETFVNNGSLYVVLTRQTAMGITLSNAAVTVQYTKTTDV